MRATNAGDDSKCRSLSRQYNSDWARRLLKDQKPVAGWPYGTMISSVVSARSAFSLGFTSNIRLHFGRFCRILLRIPSRGES